MRCASLAELPGGGYRRSPSREPVIDQDCGLAVHVIPFWWEAVLRQSALNVFGLALGQRLEALASDAGALEHLILDIGHAAWRDGTNAKLRLPWRAHFARDHRLEPRTEGFRDLVCDYQATPNQPQYDRILRSVCPKRLSQLLAGVGTVLEDHGPPSYAARFRTRRHSDALSH
jgi:hypothetical protein